MEHASDQFAVDLDRIIRTHGWQVTTVYGDRTSDTVHYTVGLTEQRRPELYLAGFHPDVGHLLINSIARAFLDSSLPDPFSGGPVAIDGLGVPTTVTLRAPRAGECEPLGAAHQRYRGRFAHLVCDIEGWPCPRCTELDYEAEACTCTLNCCFRTCRKRPTDTLA